VRGRLEAGAPGASLSFSPTSPPSGRSVLDAHTAGTPHLEHPERKAQSAEHSSTANEEIEVL
jgi:hypothetical protein